MMLVYEISEAGTVTAIPIRVNDPKIQAALQQVREQYQRLGFKRPWVSFLAFQGGECVGVCGYKTAPQNERVEIFYTPFPEKEIPGFQGTVADMTRKLWEIAQFHNRRVDLITRTSAQESATTTLLKQLGFSQQGEVDDPQAGKMWEWSIEWPGKKKYAPKT